MKGSLKNVNILVLKKFLLYYTAVNATQGNVSLYIEMTAEEGKIKGYVKLFITELKITPPREASPLKKIYNSVASVVAKVIKNPEKNTIATQINFEGSIENPDTSLLSIIFYSLRHAFIQALVPQIDHSVKIDILFKDDTIKYTQRDSNSRQ